MSSDFCMKFQFREKTKVIWRSKLLYELTASDAEYL